MVKLQQLLPTSADRQQLCSHGLAPKSSLECLQMVAGLTYCPAAEPGGTAQYPTSIDNTRTCSRAAAGLTSWSVIEPGMLNTSLM